MIEIKLYQKDIHKGSLVLVNARYPLLDYHDNLSLIPVSMQYPDTLMETKAAAVLSHLMDELSEEKDCIVPVSGYRSHEEQEYIYQDSLSKNGHDFTKKYVALPNHSEHQTGLAIDLAERKKEIDFIRPHFPYAGICNEFRNKAPHYGFVERYPKDKEHITGIAQEPWHFRYVGYPHSRLMQEQNLTLEEYIEELRSYPYAGNHLMTSHKGQTIEIFFIDLSRSVQVRMLLPENSLYQISGNNVDGFIVTLWRKENE